MSNDLAATAVTTFGLPRVRMAGDIASRDFCDHGDECQEEREPPELRVTEFGVFYRRRWRCLQCCDYYSTWTPREA